MALTLEQLYPQAKPSTALTVEQMYPPAGASTALTVEQMYPSAEPEVEKKTGWKSFLVKGIQDMYDMVNITKAGFGAYSGAADVDEEELIQRLSSLSEREQEYQKSQQHLYFQSVIEKEGKDADEAKGFVDTSLAYLDMLGKGLWAGVTNPQGFAEFTASQVGNQAASLVPMIAGFISPIPGGAYAGMAAGEMAVETGGAVLEALHHRGINVLDKKALREAIYDPEVMSDLYKEGLIKAGIIAASGFVGMGAGSWILKGPSRRLAKDLAKAGITDDLAKGGLMKALVAEQAGDKAVKAALKKYAGSVTGKKALARGAGATVAEISSEGFGEGFGQLGAFGEVSAAEVGLEMLGAIGQSAVQTSLIKGLGGVKDVANRHKIRREQARLVAEGESSGIEPEDINSALQGKRDAVGGVMDANPSIILQWEEVIAESDNAESVADTIRSVSSYEELPQYRQILQETLQKEGGFKDVVPIFLALSKEEQATLIAGGDIGRPVKGSLSHKNVRALSGRKNNKGEVVGGQDVVLVNVPIASVIMRGNWKNVELVVDSKGMKLAAVPQATPKAETQSTLATKLQAEANALARQDVEKVLQREVEIGELDSQATERPKKEVETDVREAQNKAANKLAQLREEENYENVGTLQAALDRNKIPVFPGQRKKRPPLALALQNYRKALQKPDSIDAVNSVLAPTGYKLTKKKAGVYIVPIEDKPALRIPNTGNREVGQSTVDDYLFWINEEKTQKKPETTERKQKTLRDEAEREEARKPPRENVQAIIDSIESNFVTREGDTVTIDEDGLTDILAQTENITTWSQTDRKRLDQYVKSVRREQSLETKPKKAPVKGTTITVPQSAGALASLESSFKRTGKAKFIERVRKLLTNKKGNDALLEQIAKAYRKATPGKVEGDVASILTLTGKADQADIAKVYALANMLITLRNSVSTIRPDNSLAIEDGNLSAFMRFDKVLGGVQENQLVGQIKQVFGEDATYTRIDDLEVVAGYANTTSAVVVTNPKLTPIQFARRFGRLRGKRNDIRKSELFTAQIETHTHDWAKDPTGESIRSEIRQLGFANILQYVADRRTDYLDLAEEFGAKDLDRYRQAPEPPSPEVIIADDAEEDEVSFSLESQADEYPVAKGVVDGRKVSSSPVPNTGSISASLEDYEILPGIREVSMSGLTSLPEDQQQPKVKALAEEIKDSGEITPLIVVVDSQGPYILEGATRFDALAKLGAKSFPALVVVDRQSEREVSAETDEGPLFSLGSTSGLSGKARTTWTRLRKTPNRTKRTVSEVGVALTEHYRKVYGEPLDLTNPEDYKLAANILAAEMKYQLQEDSTGESWYSTDVAEAYKITQEIISNIKDRDLSILHAFVASITSIDKMVDVNWRNATLVSKVYSETGTVPFRDPLTKGQFGYPVMAQQLRMLNNMLKDWRPEQVAKWLLEEHTVRELNSVRKEYGGLGKQADLIGGADAIFLGSDVIGPKTGTFFKNIMGISDAESLTIDKWATRTINRIIGRMVEEKHGPWTGKLSDQGLIDSPRSPAERAIFKRLFVDAGRRNGLIKTRDDGTIDFTDSQAVPWFFEQQLFTALGATSTPLGFSDGAKKALREYKAGKIPDNFSPDSVQQGNATAVREIKALAAATVPKEGATESLTPIDKPASGGLSTSGVRKALVARFGAKGVARLEADGILKIVDSATDLPAGLITDQDAAQRARGLFDPKTNTAYLIANRLNGITAPKVLLHEVGTHFGLKRMMGAEAYANLIIALEDGKDTTFKPWFDRIRANYKGRVNEGTERFAEEVLAAIAEDTSNITLSLRQSIIRAIKAFLNQFLGVQFANQVNAKEIGYLVQGSLRGLMKQNDLASVKLPRYMLMDGDVQLGTTAIAFPEYTAPTRRLTDAHKRYDIISAIDRIIPRSESVRLRRNMDGMMKVAERVFKKGYKDIDVHLPVVSQGGSITSRYAMFRNTRTGTELVIRMSDHAKDPFVAAGSFPFVSYNNGHLTDMVDFTEIDRAVKLLSAGKLDGMNGLQFQFEYSMGDGVNGVSKVHAQKFSYEDFLRFQKKKAPSAYNRIIENSQMELGSAAVIGGDGPAFSIAPDGGLSDEAKAAIDATTGGGARRSVGEVINDGRSRWLEKLTQNWVDAYRPIRNLLGDGATRAWQMMQLSENVHGMLHTMLHSGSPKAVYRNGEFDWYEVDFSNDGLLDILKDLDGEADRFMAWMVYTRANRLMGEDREQNFTEAQIAAGLTLNQQTRQDMMTSGRDRRLVYAKAMRKMSKMQDAVLQMAIDAGVIDPTVREQLSTDFYVPFYREFTYDGKTGVRGATPSHDFVNIKSVIKRLRGSELNIHDALHNMMMNWSSLMSAAMKNRAGSAAMKAAVKSGAARLLTDKKQIANIAFSKGKSKNEKFDSYVYTLEEGKKVWYEVSDPLVLNAMSHLAWGGVDSKALQTLSTFKRWLTIGVTASPAFKIRNMIRDTLHSIAVGKLSFNFFGNATKGYAALKNDNLITANMMMGGAIFQFGFYNDDPMAIRRMVDAVGDSKIINTSAKARKFMGSLFGWYQDIGNRMENANRATLYARRKEEVGHLAASHESRDLMNFSSHGRGVAAQWLTAASPFLNARIQGLSKLARSGEKGSRARLIAVVGTITMASILLRLSYEGDEEYEALEEWQKNTYWPIKVPGTKDFFFLPKPFEIGAIASVGERITENFIRDMGNEAFGGTNEDFLFISKYTQLRIRDILMDQLAMDWRPQIAKPVVELWQNKNAFTGRQIENITWKMKELPKHLRARAYTSEFALKSSWAMGELLDIFGGKDSDLHISPVQIDHLIKGYFGWLGATTTGMFDVLSGGVDPTTRVDEMRGLLPLGSFYQGSPKKSSKYMTLFYEQLGEVNKLKAAFDAYKGRQMADEARAVVTDNLDVYRWLKTYNKVNTAFQKMNKRIGLIYDDDEMSPADKRKEIDSLNERKVELAKKIVLIRAERETEEGIESKNPLGSLRSQN